MKGLSTVTLTAARPAAKPLVEADPSHRVPTRSSWKAARSRNRHMMQPLPLLLAAGVLLGAGSPPGGEGAAPPLTLFDFGKAFERKLLATTDAVASVTRAGALALRTGHRADWPGATLKAPKGKWDLSRYAFIECEAVNRGAEPVEIHCRVDNPGADGVRRCLTA